MKNIISKINELPSLEQTVIEVLEFSNLENQTSQKLINIIEKDPLTTITLLKVANSALFAFRNKVDSIEHLIHLLGINFTVSLVIGNAIQNKFDVNFSPYGIDSNQFRESSYITSNFLNVWLSKVDIELKNKLILPAFLVDVGKYILSTELIKRGLDKKFLEQITLKPENIFEIEKAFFGLSSIDVTVLLLKQWKISESIINHIAYINDIEKAPKDYLQSAQILNIAKTICNLTNPMDDNFVALGLQKAKEFNFNSIILLNSISTIKDRIEAI